MLETRSCRKAPEFKQEKPRKWRKKTCKKTKLASSTTHWLFLLVNSSHSFSCFSASLQVQQFLLMLKKSKKHIKRNATGSNKRTPPSPHKRFFFHPPRSLLPSQPVYFPTLYPTLFTTHPQIYLLPACHTTYLSLCLTLRFFFLLPTYLLFTISHSDDDEPGLFLFCQFCDDDVHS